MSQNGTNGSASGNGPSASAAQRILGGEIIGRAQIDRDVEADCDVVIVGSGAGGATMAAELAEGGLTVIVLEEGAHHRTEEFTPAAGKALRTLYRDAGAAMTIGSTPIIYSEGRCVGGSTVINGGMTWRTPPRILEKWALEDELRGIRPKDMERIFERVEKRISAKTQDPESIGRDNQLLALGAKKLGYKTLDNIRNQVHCTGTNNCAFGCPTGAKRSALLTYVPRAVSRGARIFADCRVTEITREGKRATGVKGHFVLPNGKPASKLVVRAKVVVIAGGAAQTPALLWRSGFRSPSGMLGKNLTLHPNAKVVGIFDEDVRGWQGVHQAYQVREFQEEGFLFAAVNIPPSILAMTLPQHGRVLGDLMKQYNQMVVSGVLVEDSTSGHVKVAPGGRPVLFYEITDIDVMKIRRGVALLSELLFKAGAKRVMLPFVHSQDLVGPDEVAKIFSAPLRKQDIEMFTVHIMSTCRMGRDAARSVCDDFGRFHDAAGLFVSDASVLPSAIGVNPMETIMALATRNAEHILDNKRRYLG
jgi:choline dehydrogenase-like flavoprotein